MRSGRAGAVPQSFAFCAEQRLGSGQIERHHFEPYTFEHGKTHAKPAEGAAPAVSADLREIATAVPLVE
jgi:hypothetical protein